MNKEEKKEVREYLKNASSDRKNELKNFCIYAKYITPTLQTKEHIKNYKKAMNCIRYVEQCLKEGV